MNKNIVLCSDGTGNQDIKARGTNVYKLYEAVNIHDHKGDTTGIFRPQVAFYDDGVGTQSLRMLRILGGAFGVGFCWNVQKLYRQLARVYVPGDHIYLFGFSRGAYTIRALAGMIQYCGVTNISNGLSDPRLFHKHVEKCWKVFYDACFTTERDFARMTRVPDDARKDEREKIARRERLLAHEPDKPINIELVGVWDTVGAVGMPVDELKHITDLVWKSRFNDLIPGEEIKRARHALALDDERQTFTPELWNEKKETDPERVKQVWFAGVHSNVGGGYPKHGMSLVSLDWMMAEAEKAGPHKQGLRFVDADRLYAGTHQDVHDKLYDSRAGLGIYYRWRLRDVYALCEKHGVTPKIHVTVFERIAMRTDGYAPGNIPYASEVVVTEPSVWPGNTALAATRNLMSQAGTARSPLEEIKDDITSGRSSYWVFLPVSIVGLFTLASMVGLSTIAPLVGLSWIPGLDTVFRSMPTCTAWEFSCTLRAYVVGLVAVIGVVVWFWSDAVDTSIDRKLTAFWEKLRKDLRQILLGETPPKKSTP